MALRLIDQVAIVVGVGSSGPGWDNGKASAVLSAREGANVFRVDINLQSVEETRDIISSTSHLPFQVWVFGGKATIQFDSVLPFLWCLSSSVIIWYDPFF